MLRLNSVPILPISKRKLLILFENNRNWIRVRSRVRKSFCCRWTVTSLVRSHRLAQASSCCSFNTIFHFDSICIGSPICFGHHRCDSGINEINRESYNKSHWILACVCGNRALPSLCDTIFCDLFAGHGHFNGAIDVHQFNRHVQCPYKSYSCSQL